MGIKVIHFQDNFKVENLSYIINKALVVNIHWVGEISSATCLLSICFIFVKIFTWSELFNISVYSKLKKKLPCKDYLWCF